MLPARLPACKHRHYSDAGYGTSAHPDAGAPVSPKPCWQAIAPLDEAPAAGVSIVQLASIPQRAHELSEFLRAAVGAQLNLGTLASSNGRSDVLTMPASQTRAV
jgi:hypothetical protein